MGKAVTAGASAFALGSLCYYGLGLSNERGTIDTHMYVKKFLILCYCLGCEVYKLT